MDRRITVAAVVAVVVLAAVAALVVTQREQVVSEHEAENIEYHPVSNMDSTGDENMGPAGNTVLPYLRLTDTVDGWAMDQEYAFDVADGYKLKYLKVTTVLPEGAAFESYVPSAELADITVVTRGIASGTEFTEDGAMTMVMFGDDMGNGPTIGQPEYLISGWTQGPLNISYEAMFTDGAFLKERVEIVRGSFSLWTDAYENTYAEVPWPVPS